MPLEIRIRASWIDTELIWKYWFIKSDSKMSHNFIPNKVFFIEIKMSDNFIPNKVFL